jgi:predicted dinucleotide-binding enzyme
VCPFEDSDARRRLVEHVYRAGRSSRRRAMHPAAPRRVPRRTQHAVASGTGNAYDHLVGAITVAEVRVVRIAVIGSGNVGLSLANGFVAGGNDVTLGTRDASKPSLAHWVAAGRPTTGYREATEWGELVCLAVPGRLVRQTVLDIGPAAFGDKIVIDATNPVLITEDSVVSAYGEDLSAGEVVQQALPEARVVKAFNQIAAPEMLAPGASKRPRHMRICGNDETAKAVVAELLAPYGWAVTDLGGIEHSRALEATTLKWVRSQRGSS